MNKKEAAEHLGISVRTLERLASNGRLKKRRVKGKTGPIIDFDPGDLDNVKKELEQARPSEVFGRPNSPKPIDAIGFRLDPHYMRLLEELGRSSGSSPGAAARRLVIRGLEVGDELLALRKSLSQMFYLILVSKMDASEAEAEDVLRLIDGGS